MGRHKVTLSVFAPQALFRLDGHVAFVSAAPGRLGHAMARALAGVGAHVIVNASDDAKLQDLEGELVADGLSTVRAALFQLARRLAGELGKENIRVNALAPGPFPHPHVQANKPEFAKRLAVKNHAGPALRGVRDRRSAAVPGLEGIIIMTGHALSVDGGWTAW
jgi:NAD(P)-dependent dehydrogenase (short-subunit alcohol dehydrogenase family)